MLDEAEWVSFDLSAIVVDALTHNPRIAAVTHRAAIAMERIVQEDAVFDPSVLLESKLASTSDPVGNTLTTGGPSRLQDDSWNSRAGVVRTTRDGTKIDLSQQAGLLNSNSLFFAPSNQGNTRLNLSVIRPLQAGAGRVYNERLILQARIDSNVTLQQMREDVQDRLGLTMATYWKLYQTRCHLLQERALLERGLEVERLVVARRGFDSGELEISKVNSRITRHRDDVIALERDVKNLQTQLAALVSSESLRPGLPLEMIPLGVPSCIGLEVDVRDAVITAMSNRMDVRSAALALESASLEISVTRNELLPKLDAVVGGYLAGLEGQYNIARSFGDQFATGRPSVNGGLVYDLPYGRRASRSRYRAAHQRYLELGERYRESVATTQSEVETAIRNLGTALTRLETKRQIWEAAVKQESLQFCRWESMGPDGQNAALVLEDLLDQQDRRTQAEQDVVTSEVEYIISLIELQTSMGTLLTAEGIEPIRTGGAKVHWTHEPRIENAVESESVPVPVLDEMIETESGS
jgi:outer membrane protein TolC